MAESIESFVKKLQSEGIDAGKKAAEKIKRDARQDTEKMLSAAKKEAENIIAKAKKDADKYRFRMQTEVELAVRDAILKLRESLSLALSTLLTKRIENKLSDADYLGGIIRDVIIAYAKDDAERRNNIEINIPKKMKDKLIYRVLNDLFQKLKFDQDKMRLKATLSKAGFEYKIHGATIEVSPDSVAELLSEMVNPLLQEMIDKAFNKPNEESRTKKRGSERGKISDTEQKNHKNQGSEPNGEET